MVQEWYAAGVLLLRAVTVWVAVGWIGVLWGQTALAADRVRSAVIGGDGLVHITTGSKSEFVAPREGAGADPGGVQAAVEAPAIAADGKTVGWLVDFQVCCQSYPIPLELVVYRNGRILRRIQSASTPEIWRWKFIEGGKRVAYYVEFPHGGRGVGCELRDVETGRLLGQWIKDEGKPLPAWAEAFRGQVMD